MKTWQPVHRSDAPLFSGVTLLARYDANSTSMADGRGCPMLKSQHARSVLLPNLQPCGRRSAGRAPSRPPDTREVDIADNDPSWSAGAALTVLQPAQLLDRADRDVALGADAEVPKRPPGSRNLAQLDRTVRSRLISPERAPFEPAPLRAFPKPLNS